MLHGHVERLLDHRIVKVHVTTRADDRLRAATMVEAVLALLLEATFTGVENHSVLQVLVAWLVEGTGTRTDRLAFLILTGARDVELQGLSKEHLVEVESGGGGIEADLLPSDLVVIGGTGLLVPVIIGVRSVSQAGGLVLDTDSFLVFEHHLAIGRLRYDLLARARVARQ